MNSWGAPLWDTRAEELQPFNNVEAGHHWIFLSRPGQFPEVFVMIKSRCFFFFVVVVVVPHKTLSVYCIPLLVNYVMQSVDAFKKQLKNYFVKLAFVSPAAT